MLTFARLHLDGGVAGDGTRLLSEESVSDMPRPRAAIPSIGGREAVGLTWRIDRWGGRQVDGHDGRTIGQSAFLRVDPASGVAVCLLTNSPEAGRLYYQLFSEIFGHYAGITPAAEPEPGDRTDGADGADGVDLARHACRYERTSRRYDVVVRDGRLRVTDSLTDDRAEFSDDGPRNSTCTRPAARPPGAASSSAGSTTASPGVRRSSTGWPTRRRTSTSAAGSTSRRLPAPSPR